MDYYVSPIHQEILKIVNQSGSMVIVDTHKVCENGLYDGYFITSKDNKNQSGKNELVICFHTIQKNYSDWTTELNRTISHEAVHVAQECKSKNGYIRRLGFDKDAESEAFAIQDNPKEVLRIVKKYCL